MARPGVNMRWLATFDLLMDAHAGLVIIRGIDSAHSHPDGPGDRRAANQITFRQCVRRISLPEQYPAHAGP